jgi:hypothetical protein
MAEINIGLIKTNCLQTAPRITFLTIGKKLGILANAIAECLAAAVAGDGIAFVIDGENSQLGDAGKGILQSFPLL